MVKLIYSGGKAALINAVNKANEILTSDSFYQAIAALPQMDNTELPSADIANTMREASQPIVIDTYWRPWGRANASTSGATRIKVNSSKISSRLPTAVNTLVHETVHAIDFLNGTLDFTHHGNHPDGEANTAPWRIGTIAQNMATQ